MGWTSAASRRFWRRSRRATRAALTRLLDPLHAADIADLLEQIGGADRRGAAALWSGEIDGEILSEIDEVDPRRGDRRAAARRAGRGGARP